jgi:type VI protein secretion system component VasK
MTGTEDTSSRDADLAGRAMGAIDQLVDTLHAKVIRPILLIGRTIAFSFVIVVCALVVAVVAAIALLRLLDVYAFAAHPWASWAVLGTVFLLAGTIIWRFRTAPDAKATSRARAKASPAAKAASKAPW